MILWEFPNAEVCQRYFQVILELGIESEKEKIEILTDFARNGELSLVSHTNRTPEQLANDLSREFKVLHIKPKQSEETLNAVWTKDSETSVEWLMDRDTNRRLAKRIGGVIYPVGNE